MLTSVILLLIQIGLYLVAGSHWTYSEQELWPASCDGRAQSPIAIVKKETTLIHSDHFKFSRSYSEVNQANLTNTGHSIEIKLINNENPLTISGGGLNEEYILTAFHFHWGSEHVVNDYRYPLEGHFVHYNSKYGDLTTALNYKDGIAVLGVFYDFSEKSNKAFNILPSVIPFVAHSINNPETLQKSIRVTDFLPEETSNFYRYWGSLTTPDCNEVVTWTLFTKPSYISNRQVELFTTVWTEDDERLLINYRQLQDLNARNVYYVTSQ